MFALLTVITLFATLAQYLSFKRMAAYVRNELKFHPPTYTPKVSVILPCKGLDPGFETNVRKLLSQEYYDPATAATNFEVLFTVASEDDPAFILLKKLLEESFPVKTKLIVSGVSPKRGQKINNQLAALDQIDPASQVLAFVDSDVVARKDFLKYLVAHLEDSNVGVTTGYRFYVPFKGDWPSLIRSLWNRMSAWELANPKLAFAWGGAMAVRKSVFDEAGVRSHWEHACDDDLSLTCAVKDIGLSVRFVPQCLVVSNGDASLPEVLEWTNRQLILTKVYYPQLWRKAIVRAFILTFWLCAVLGAICGWLLTSSRELFLAALAGLTLLPIELIFLWQAQGLWANVLKLDASSDKEADCSPFKIEPKVNQAFADSLWRFTAVLPLAHLVLPWMTLYSLSTNRIKWRGITYELRGPTETVII